MSVNMHMIGALGLLSGAPQGSVASYTARVPVTGDAFGNIGTSITRVGEKLTNAGWITRTRGIQTGVGWFTGAAKFGKMEVTLQKKGGAPFHASDAEAAIQKAANSVGLGLAVIGEWAAQTVAFVVEAPGTALSDKGLAQTTDVFSTTIDKVGKFGWDSIPTWAKVAGGVGVGIFVLAQVASIAKAVRT